MRDHEPSPEHTSQLDLDSISTQISRQPMPHEGERAHPIGERSMSAYTVSVEVVYFRVIHISTPWNTASDGENMSAQRIWKATDRIALKWATVSVPCLVAGLAGIYHLS